MRKDVIQFNTRVSAKKKEAVDKVCESSEFTRDEIAEAALDALFGWGDAFAKAKRAKIAQLAKQLSLSRSFNAPEHQPAGFSE